jgi:4a-hydroxytetrahydrobiopterin dehydratase
MTALANMHCAPGGQAIALSDADIKNNLAQLNGWSHVGNEIKKTFAFKNYHETMAFVNASAWVSHREDHHPDMSVHYNRCVVAYSTHDAAFGKGGITLNDFICAAKLDALDAFNVLPA